MIIEIAALTSLEITVIVIISFFEDNHKIYLLFDIFLVFLESLC
jgi:hypothetical protein